MKKTNKHERLTGWFQLLRLPHIFTVPGDPLAGFLIAGGLLLETRGFFSIAAACFISMAVSLFGIITNDLADIQIDSTQHPDRPLPRGVVSPRAASYAAQLCFLAAVVPAICLGWRFFFVTFVALISIYTYNFYVKYRPKRASMMMAVMRDLTFGLGILVVSDIPIWRILMLILYGVGLFLYYCGLNEITRSETLSKMVRPGGGKMLAGACCCCAVVVVFLVIHPSSGQTDAQKTAAVPANAPSMQVSDTQASAPADMQAADMQAADIQQKASDAQASVPASMQASDAQKTTASHRNLVFGLLAVLLCAVYLLVALWVYQVSRTGASPARVQMAVHVSFRAALLVQSAVTASCGLVVLPVVLLLCLAFSAFAEKYSCS